MEEMEMTPMAAGAAVQVNTPDASGIQSEGRSAPTEHEDNVVEGVFEAPEVEEVAPVEEADMLLTSAKDEGFEEALTHLADGDFEKTKPEEESNEPAKKAENDVAEIDKTDEPELNEIEKQELIEKINVLEEQVTNLEEKTKELTERLKISEANLKVSLETLLAMALLMHELIKKERDQKKKASLLEFLIAFMGKLLISIVDPEAEQKDKKKGPDMAPDENKVSDIDELLKYLKEKGFGGSVDTKAAQPSNPTEINQPLAA